MTTDGTISIRVNGEHRRVSEGLTLAQLASELGLEPSKVAVDCRLSRFERTAFERVISDIQ